jgi:hypothetical protein
MRNKLKKYTAVKTKNLFTQADVIKRKGEIG